MLHLCPSSAKVGDIIILKDAQTLKEQMDTGEFTDGVECMVSNVQHFLNSSGIKWTVIEFSEVELVLIIKRVFGNDDKSDIDDNVDYKIYYRPDGAVLGNRADWAKAGMLDVLFESQDVPLVELLYVETITNDDGIVFKQKCGSLIAESDDEEFCLITEWVTEDKCDNPELIVLEIGGVDSDEGGYIMFLQGVSISINDLELLPN